MRSLGKLGTKNPGKVTTGPDYANSSALTVLADTQLTGTHPALRFLNFNCLKTRGIKQVQRISKDRRPALVTHPTDHQASRRIPGGIERRDFYGRT